MYRHIVRALSTLGFLTAFWPAIRAADITIFDWLSSLVILFAAPYKPKERGAPLRSFNIAIAGVALFVLAALTSVFSSRAPIEHIIKAAKVSLALTAMIGIVYLLQNRKIFSIGEALTLLCISASISSFVCILQGHFGILAQLIPDSENGVQEWARMTGLAQHPIEAGYVSSFGTVIALGMALHTRRWFFYLPLGLINIYSLRFSASLTALFAMVCGCGVLFLYARAQKAHLAFLALGVMGSILALSSGAPGKLTDRVEGLVESGSNYETLQLREIQLTETLKHIDIQTIFIGNGYSLTDLPEHLEIHNGFLASLFHFGILGLTSQILLISFFCACLRHDAPPSLKGMLLACILVFTAAYMTGPPFSRRSLWIPLLTLGAYLTTPPPRKQVLAPRNLLK